jgi:hypothetical protein
MMRTRSRRRGHALLAALIITLIMGALGLVVASLGDLNTRRASSARAEDQLRCAARAGLAQTRVVLWEAYRRGATPSTAGLRAHLDGLGLDDGETQWLAPGGDALQDLEDVALAWEGGPGMVGVAGVQVRVSARREDVDDDTFLTLRAVASHGPDQRVAEEVVRIGQRPFEGFRFALLAENVDRTLVRATFDNREHRLDPTDGPYERVKVGVVGPLRLQNNAQTVIAGTLYTSGVALNAGGNPVAAPTGGAGGVQAYAIDIEDGTIDYDPLKKGDLVDSLPSGEPYGNYYAEYPRETTEQFDGYFPPGMIPSAVPDLDGDRRVSDAEWDAFAAEHAGGSLNGVVVGIAPNQVYTGLTLPVVGNVLGFASGTPDMNLVVVGTGLTPITVDGDVAIDGDLVITGPITGTGTLIVRGNIYILGDLSYTDDEDLIGLIAGGNILSGDYGMSDGVAVGPLAAPLPLPMTDATMTGYTAQELAMYNRMEWTRSMPFFDTATNLPTNVDTGVANVAYQPGYVPRFYTLDPAQAPRMFINTGAGQKTVWDNADGVWLGPNSNPNTTIDVAAIPNEAVVGLNPTDPWINATTLSLLQTSASLLGLANGSPTTEMKVSGLLFSGNAVLLKSAAAGGTASFDGAVIGANVGVRAPAGLKVDYDDRVRELIVVPDGVAGAVEAFAVLRREP